MSEIKTIDARLNGTNFSGNRVEIATEELVALNDEVKELRAAYEALENERDELKQSLDDLQERFNGIKFIESELRKENDSLNAEVLRLKNELIASLKDWHDMNANHEALQKENAGQKKRVEDLVKAYDREIDDCLTALKERDYWYDKADSLADKIGEVFDVPVGEHSNVNCPFDEANKILDGEYVTKFDKQNEALKAENEAQAKRIAELEAATEHLGLTPQQAKDGLARHKAQVAEIEALRKQVDEHKEWHMIRDEMRKALEAQMNG